MLDFLKISTKVDSKKKRIDISPNFVVSTKPNDLMIQGKDFYAVWDDKLKMWQKDEQSVISQIDAELEIAAKQSLEKHPEYSINVAYMSDSDSGSIDRWHKYVQKQMRDCYHSMDDKIIFASTKVSKRDYASKRLSYDLVEMPIPAYEELMSTLYDPEERDKLEWAIGAIISGDSKTIQKFIVLYGDAGSGKSTFLKIVEKLFESYVSVFNAKEIAAASSQFALESFKDNPLVSIQHDGDLSKIEDNTKLNSIVSHEKMLINEKFKAQYTARFNAFLFMGTNKPVKITDSRSGIVRRLIDVRPSGRKIKPYSAYKRLMTKIESELGGIAWYCLNKYNHLGESYYDMYVPYEMIRATNNFYDFVQEYYDDFASSDYIDLATAWSLYNTYSELANVKNKMERRVVGNELKNYYREFKPDTVIDGKHKRNVYIGFKKEKFEYGAFKGPELEAIPKTSPIGEFLSQASLFDIICDSVPAQYATESGQPRKAWNKVDTKLKDLDTSQLHYVNIDEHHIVIDFDMKNEKGEKDFFVNLSAVEAFLKNTGLPPTYAELSRSGGGIHLHYIYDGDVTKLSRLYDDNIEVKIYTGGQALRRQLTKCNNIQIKHISSGLPLKGDKPMINYKSAKDNEGLIRFINSCIEKKHHGYTTPEVQFIKSELDKAYADKSFHYDVTSEYEKVLAFANNSTHNSAGCVKLVSQMHFKSEEQSEPVKAEKKDIVFFDVEVFKNLFVVCWKKWKNEVIHKMINPSAKDIAELCKYNLVGFNNLRYDNYILAAAMANYNTQQLYTLSQKIINGARSVGFSYAKNISYTDIYDFCAKKQSLKKWEIELGIHHQELGLKWDIEVPENMFETVAGYCCNDVSATEKVFEENYGDFVAREILADIAGMTVNDTTNNLTTKIIFEGNRHPQLEYTDLSKDFPGYEYVNGKNIYNGEDVGRGGYVFAEPGMYFGNIVTFDSASHHPHSILAMNMFGEYTKNFKALLDARIFIKHKDYDSAKKLFNGKLEKYLTDQDMAKALSKALKIAINSVYGLTSASFDTPFKDPRNVNNIVALRGALFMVNLKNEIIKRGFKVIHIKTDSVKVVNPTKELSDFINEYAAKYGYEFEIEHKFSKLCLVNDAVFIAKLSDDDPEEPGKWTATGAQFAQPYVFKTLFSHDPIKFDDMCETKSVTTALYLDMNEGLPEDEHNYKFVGKVGQFTPIKSGCGGGILCREGKDEKFTSATGAKGYRWLESETVKLLNKQEDIDKNYYRAMVDKAVEDISKFGDFESFINYESNEVLDITSDVLPF